MENTTIITTISFLGLIYLSKQTLCFFIWVYKMFLRPPKNLTHYGSWALITGCTDGIGKALAFDLAEKGLNLVLVGRNPSKLEDTCQQIINRGRKVEMRSVVLDMEKSSGEDIERKVKEAVEGLDVGVVINNAGVAYPSPKFFNEVETELIESVVKVNIDGATWVTKAVIPGMLKKKKGAIVNIGSGSSVIVPSFPLYTIYAATKAYLGMFSRSIYVEYKEKGIDVQCQIPLFVATKMSEMRSSLFIPSPEEYSRASVRWIGYEHICQPYWAHSLQGWFTTALPDWVSNWLVYASMVKERRRKMRKQAMKAKCS